MFKNKRSLYWALACGWTIFIYSTLSLVSIIRKYLEKRIPLYDILTVFVVLTLVCVVVYFLKQYRNRINLYRYVLLGLVLGCYAYGIATIKYPIEKIHFVQYGFLAFFVFRALACDFKKFIPYMGAFLITTLVGYGDELIQGILPNRHYDDRDVMLNAISAGLALVLVYVFGGCENRGVV